ncbi:MAG: YggT family protein [Acidimicrobiales bacterium]
MSAGGPLSAVVVPALLGVGGGNVFVVLGQLYVIIMILRAVFSFFPMSSTSALAPVARVTFVLTEPVVAPFRRIIPPIGMFDMSYLVALIVVEIIVAKVLPLL